MEGLGDIETIEPVFESEYQETFEYAEVLNRFDEYMALSLTLQGFLLALICILIIAVCYRS